MFTRQVLVFGYLQYCQIRLTLQQNYFSLELGEGDDISAVLVEMRTVDVNRRRAYCQCFYFYFCVLMSSHWGSRPLYTMQSVNSSVLPESNRHPGVYWRGCGCGEELK